jgi:predicted secreted protein
MMPGMQFLQTLACHMSIYLRRREVTMTEQHLHHTQIRTVIEQVRGEGMPQGMG